MGIAPAEPTHLPPGERINPDTPAERQCYDLEGFKGLLRLDADFTECSAARAVQKDMIHELEAAVANLQKVTELQADSIKRLEAETTRMFDLWKNENKRRHEAENKPRIGTWVGWSLAGVMTVASAILVTVIVVDD